MANEKIEFDEKCKSCRGTGLYIGMAERDGSAVVCHTCKGTGCHHFVYEYEEFKNRIEDQRVKRVYQVNPGIIIGKDKGRYKLSDFGGISYNNWISGKPFGKGTENRLFTCPAWWYQSADHDKKPNWPECIILGSFSRCVHFAEKDKCWDRWDRENK